MCAFIVASTVSVLTKVVPFGLSGVDLDEDDRLFIGFLFMPHLALDWRIIIDLVIALLTGGWFIIGSFVASLLGIGLWAIIGPITVAELIRSLDLPYSIRYIDCFYRLTTLLVRSKAKLDEPEGLLPMSMNVHIASISAAVSSFFKLGMRLGSPLFWRLGIYNIVAILKMFLLLSTPYFLLLVLLNERNQGIDSSWRSVAQVEGGWSILTMLRWLRYCVKGLHEVHPLVDLWYHILYYYAMCGRHSMRFFMK